MKRFLTLSAIVLAAFQAEAQQTQLSPSLAIAAKEGLQKLEEQKQHDIAFYSKNNTPQQEASAAKAIEADFYQLYITDDNNRYYNNYHNNNTDPIITSMPSPGPNLDYYYVDPNSSGNYDKAIPQK